MDVNQYMQGNDTTLAWIFAMNDYYQNTPNTYYRESSAAPQDLVTGSANGAWNNNIGIIQSIDGQYQAQLISAKDSATFDSIWSQYMNALQGANWSDANADMLSQLSAAGL